MDWMYQGGMLAKQEADQRTEEAMMTGKPIQQEESTELNRVCSLTMAFTTWPPCYIDLQVCLFMLCNGILANA